MFVLELSNILGSSEKIIVLLTFQTPRKELSFLKSVSTYKSICKMHVCNDVAADCKLPAFHTWSKSRSRDVESERFKSCKLGRAPIQRLQEPKNPVHFYAISTASHRKPK